ncbi:hypothetical protein JTB14_025007 [Gonioctena quinquepunctata]|nr:hypothetical protein JTB14_025007 [Gonioctena quinquepunctata]
MAVQLILKPKASDDPDSAHANIVNAKKIYAETGDAVKAYREAEKSSSSSVELKLLEGLNKNNDNDYVNALENIPRTMGLLYLHSFQSLIWNKMVSKRLKLFGMKPVEGDLVLTEENKEGKETTTESVTENEESNEKQDDSISQASEANEDFKCKKEVKVLTSDDLPNYTIYDIVLPLPGYDIIYPENLKPFYKEALEENELTLEMTKQKVRKYNLCGDYRKILERVKDLSWKTIRYNDPTDNLIRSDFQELRGESEPVSDEGGKFKALILEFSLTSSAYATMVLRELMKCETSSFVHSQFNDYHEKKEEKTGSKIVIDTNKSNTVDQTEEDSEMVQTSSLLLNKEKYEEFKNSIFSTIAESLKRPNEDADSEENTKKLKKEDSSEQLEKENDGIKIQASLI